MTDTFTIKFGTQRYAHAADRPVRKIIRETYRHHRQRACRHPDLYGIDAKRNARDEAAHYLFALMHGGRPS
ncbi:MAG TPA: hypothetical protein VGK49_00770 [Ilumatobacteraceae bacterium]